jgi:hypothetical protein
VSSFSLWEKSKPRNRRKMECWADESIGSKITPTSNCEGLIPGGSDRGPKKHATRICLYKLARFKICIKTLSMLQAFQSTIVWTFSVKYAW